jgi:Tfp pilus assembly protein FimT
MAARPPYNQERADHDQGNKAHEVRNQQQGEGKVKKIRGFSLADLLTVIVAVAMLAAWISPAMAQETKYAAGTTSATVLFGPGAYGKTVVKSVNASTDKAGGVVKFYARGGAGRVAPSAVATNGQAVLSVANAGYTFTNGDYVVYAHVDGTTHQTTVSDATTNTVTLAAGLTQAGASGDYLYEVTQQGQILVGLLGTGVGTNDVLNLSGEALFATPSASPLYVVLDGTAACVLQVTADR